MPVQSLGVEETAFPIAAPERRCGRTGVLGVAAASTSTVVPLGRRRRAAGAHPVPEITADAGRGCPSLPAAATGCLDKAAARSAGRLSKCRGRGRAPPAAGPNLVAGEAKFCLAAPSPIFAVGTVWKRAAGGVARTRPTAPALKWRVQWTPAPFALDNLGEPYLQLPHLQKRRAGTLATRRTHRRSRRAAPGIVLGEAAHKDKGGAHLPLRGGDARRAPRSYGLLLLAQERW